MTINALLLGVSNGRALPVCEFLSLLSQLVN